MIGKAFPCRRHFQQCRRVFAFDFCYGKLPFCKGTCFIKYNPFCMTQGIQHIAAFDEDAIFGCGTNAREIAQRHRQYQRTRTGYNQEDQRAPNPLRKSALSQNGRHHCQKHCQTHHRRCIYPCKTCDEFFCLGFPSGGVFHQFQNLHDSGFSERFCHFHMKETISVDTSAENGAACFHFSGQRFPGEGCRIQQGTAFYHCTIQGDFLPGFYYNHITDCHLLR